MSILLFLLTFLIAINLKEFKSSPYFPNKVRGGEGEKGRVGVGE